MSEGTKIVIHDHDPSWGEQFTQLALTLIPALPTGAQVHHIGSTAVPGLAAKDIIDIQVTVAALDDVDAAALSQRGFLEVIGLSDHQPSMRRLVASDLAKRFFRATGRPANVHVRTAGRFNQRYALLCRDYLRAHPVTAGSYEAIKRHLAAWFPNDPDHYYDIKDPVFDIIMGGAEAWADRIAWSLPKADVG